jgi:hypothetical protein
MLSGKNTSAPKYMNALKNKVKKCIKIKEMGHAMAEGRFGTPYSDNTSSGKSLQNPDWTSCNQVYAHAYVYTYNIYAYILFISV